MVLAENGVGRFLILAWMVVAAVNGERPFILPQVVEEPCQLVGAGQDGHLPGGNFVVSRVSTEKEGWAAQRPHYRRKALSSHTAWLLLSSLPADTALFTQGHVSSRKRMQTSLLREVIIEERCRRSDNWGRRESLVHLVTSL